MSSCGSKVWPKPASHVHESPMPLSNCEARACGSPQILHTPSPLGANEPLIQHSPQYWPGPTQKVLSVHSEGKSGMAAVLGEALPDDEPVREPVALGLSDAVMVSGDVRDGGGEREAVLEAETVDELDAV